MMLNKNEFILIHAQTDKVCISFTLSLETLRLTLRIEKYKQRQTKSRHERNSELDKINVKNIITKPP
jgi:hypothetical protein